MLTPRGNARRKGVFALVRDRTQGLASGQDCRHSLRNAFCWSIYPHRSTDLRDRRARVTTYVLARKTRTNAILFLRHGNKRNDLSAPAA
jgi:hypothetical protein